MAANPTAASRLTRRRLIAFGALLGISAILMLVSGSPIVSEAQRGIAFAFRPVVGAVDGVLDTISGIVDATASIDRLRAENQALRDENDRLRIENRLTQSIRKENDELTALLQLRSDLGYETVAARVIARDPVDVRRVVVLDRGSDEGIEKGDAVIAAGGALVGQVIEVGPGFAQVLLIDDSSSVVAGALSADGARGDVAGQAGSVLAMRNVDATSQVVLGDEVLTAGIELAGGIRSPFPGGLLIGAAVDTRRDPNEVVQTVFVEPAADLDGLDLALVITSYEGGLPEPGLVPVPCEPTDDGTLPGGEQPCFAPSPSP
jgi:rod shape-determining protein MreC